MDYPEQNSEIGSFSDAEKPLDAEVSGEQSADDAAVKHRSATLKRREAADAKRSPAIDNAGMKNTQPAPPAPTPPPAPPPPPPPSDSESDLELPLYQGGPKFELRFNMVVATLTESQESEYDKMQAEMSLTPKWENLTQRQVLRRKRKDKRLYAIILTALNSDKITQTSWDLCLERYIQTARR